MTSSQIEIPMGDRRIAELIASPTSETFAAVTSRLGAHGGSTDGSIVPVVTGSEPRPNSPTVLWVGGATKPANMATGDIWFKVGTAPEPSDTTPPSAPTSLTASNITSNAFTLSWTASTDNVGVTGYEVTVNGAVKSSPNTTSTILTSLTPDTDHTVSVRARDAAGNWSSASAPITTRTLTASANPTYSVFGTAAPSMSLAKATEQPITVANGFYTYGGAVVNGWRSVGMRIYVPTGVVVPATAVCHLWGSKPTDLTSGFDRTVTMTSITPGQWNEVLWEPFEVASGQVFFCSYNFGDGGYLAIKPPSDEFIAASDGTNLVLSEPDTVGGIQRAGFMFDGNPPATASVMWYGIDALIDKGAGA